MLSSCGSGSEEPAATLDKNAKPDLELAKKEGPLVVWHLDQEPDVVEFLKAFTKKTGIEAEQLRVGPGEAVQKIEQEAKAGVANVDVYMSADLGVFIRLRDRDMLHQYVSSEMDAYSSEYLSNPVGWWTTYYVNDGPIMFFSDKVPEAEGPKTWEDLADPKWKGKVCFQDSTSGATYVWWYMLKDKLPKTYWDDLQKNEPTAYKSSTAMIREMVTGNELIGGKVSGFQYTKAKRENLPIVAVYPELGTPAATQGIGIIGTTKRPNAARAYVDFMISQEGQQLWNEMQGSRSAREDVKIEGLADLGGRKLLVPSVEDLQSMGTDEMSKEFRTLWDRVTGKQ